MRDITLEDTFYMDFTTRAFATGVPTTLAGTPVLSVLEENNATPITSGVSVSVDRASVAGLNEATIVATAANGYESGKGYSLYISTGTVGGVSVVGEVVGKFTVDILLKPTVQGRSLDVAATGEAGVDLGNVTGTLTQANVGWVDANSRIDVGSWLGTAVTLSATTTKPEVDINSVSDDATAANNLELMYDTTGYTDDTAPASRLQVGNLSVGSGGISTVAESFVKAGAEPETNTFTSTFAEDGTFHIVEDDVTSTDVYYQFDLGGSGIPQSVTWVGYAQSNGDSYTVHFWNWAGASYDQVGSITATNGTTTSIETYTATTAHVGTGADLGKVRFRFLSSDGTAVATDRILVTYTVSSQSIGYEGGAVWIDTSASNTNTESFVDGTADNPVSTLAAATTIAGNLNLKKFSLIGGSSITLAQGYDSYTFLSDDGWTLATGGQSIDSTNIVGATVSGIFSGNPHFRLCEIGAITGPNARLGNCGIASTITIDGAGDWVLHHCWSEVAGTGTPAIDFGAAVLNSNVNLRGYSGGVEVQNMGGAGTDNMSLEGHGQLVINANCTGGTVAIRGHFTVTDNAGGAVTLSDDARFDHQSIIDNMSAEIGTLHDTRIPDTISLANINAQVVDVITVDAISELGVAAPSATPNLSDAVMLMYMALRNKIDITASAKEVHNDAGTVIATKTLSDDGTTYSETEMA